MKKKISVVTIGVSDLERSRRFYAGLGFEADSRSNDEAVFYPLEGAWIALFARNLLSEIARTTGNGAVPGGFVLSHNVATPAEVDEVIAIAEGAGGTVVVTPEDSEYGRIGYFADPDGVRWEVAYTPGWPELTE